MPVKSRGVNVTGLDKMICEPKVYFHYDVPPDPSTDDDFDYEPVDFHHKGLSFVPGYEPEPFGSLNREEHTLLMIKPSGLNYTSEIVEAVLNDGFTVLRREKLLLFPEQAAAFYRQHFGRPWYPKAIIRLSSEPITVMVLAKENAVEDLKSLCGPAKVSEARKTHPFSLRAKYGQRGDMSMNAVHASETVEDAIEEILYFFKYANPEPLVSVEDKFESFMGSNYAVLLEGLTDLCKSKPINPALWFHKYLVSTQKQEYPLYSMPKWPPKKEITDYDPTLPAECQ